MPIWINFKYDNTSKLKYHEQPKLSMFCLLCPIKEGGKWCWPWIFTESRTEKQNPFKRENKGTNSTVGKGKTKYFYTSLFGICEFTLLCDTGQTGTVGEPRSKLGMVLDSNLDGNPSRKINKPIPSPTAENCEYKRNRMNCARIVENTRIDITMSKSTKGHFNRCVYSGVLWN